MFELLPFISYVLITTFTPGPNNIMSMINGGKAGIKKALVFNIGIFVGFAIVMLLCGMFGIFILTYIPVIKPFMKYIGAAYILYLSYKVLKSNYDNLDKSDSNLYGFKEGFSLQFVNPKVILYGITTITTFIIPYYSSKLIILLYAIILAGIAFIATVCWAAFGALFKKILKKREKLVNIIMAVALACTAISLIV